MALSSTIQERQIRLIRALFLMKDFYLKKESTNSYLLNTCRSSMPSPTPMYLTGIWNWSEIPMTTPPLAVPSNIVIARALTCVAKVNCLACSKEFCHVEPSSTKRISSGVSGRSFCITRFTLLSSFIRFTLLCKRPAVSIITTSAPWESAEERVS